MSWLMTRSPSRRYAGWQFPEANTVAGPLVPPFVHLGDGPVADINSLKELHIPSNASSVNAGGESYAYMPFTPDWGFEMRCWFPVAGLAAQAFSVYFTNSWTEIGAAYSNVVGVRLVHAPAVYGGATGEAIQINQFANAWTMSGGLATWVTSPPVWNGDYIRIKVWVDRDRLLRVWYNDVFMGQVNITDPNFQFGPTRRAVRFLNAALCDVWVSMANGGAPNPALYHYDRPRIFPPNTVFNSQVFYDDFNRANGAVGNGWTQLGSEAQITSNSWGRNGSGADTNVAIIRNTAITNGRIRIEATAGGAYGPNNSKDSSILLCSNSSCTQALAINCYGSSMYLTRLSSAVTSPTWNDYGSMTSGLSIASGDKIGISLYDGNIWVDKNGGEPLLMWTNVNSIVPATNSYAGLRVSRGSFNDSMSWNDFRVKTVV